MQQVSPFILLAVSVIALIVFVILSSIYASGGKVTTTTVLSTTSVLSVINVTGTIPATTTQATTSQTTTIVSSIATTTVLPAGKPGQWQASSQYPLPVYNETCVGLNGYIYCIDGTLGQGFDTDSVYFAKVSQSGIGSWEATASYPANVSGLSCALYSSTVYCIGGGDAYGTVSTAYYANLSSSGVSGWRPVRLYPIPIDSTSCVIASNSLYCIGGYSYGASTDAVNHATLEDGKYTSWAATDPYPVNTSLAGCVSQEDEIYCVGGTGSQDDYYGTVNSSALDQIEEWNGSGTYPLPAYDPSCVTSSGTVYCVGGDEYNATPISNTYYASISGSGFGVWSDGTVYPGPGLGEGSCAATGGYVYCVGGINQSGSTYFTQMP